MRKLYHEFFHIPENGKIREKVMLTRIAVSVMVVVMCLAAMSFTAYAYFSYNFTSEAGVIKAAHFEAAVSVTVTGSDGEPLEVKPLEVKREGKHQVVELEAGRYTVELTRGDSTANKGFCIINIGGKKYYTDQIGVDAEKKLADAKVKFELLLDEAAKLEVLSHWGTSVYYGYKDDGRTEIFIVSGSTIELKAKTVDDETPYLGGEESAEVTTEVSSDTEEATSGTEETSAESSAEADTTDVEESEGPTSEAAPDTSTKEPEVTEPESSDTTGAVVTGPAEETTGAVTEEPVTEGAETTLSESAEPSEEETVGVDSDVTETTGTDSVESSGPAGTDAADTTAVGSADTTDTESASGTDSGEPTEVVTDSAESAESDSALAEDAEPGEISETDVNGISADESGDEAVNTVSDGGNNE